MVFDKLKLDFLNAYKNKDMFKKNFLSVLKGVVENNIGKNIEPTDENVLKVIKTIEKNIIENINSRKKINLDTTEQELELSYLTQYLPTLMSEDAIRTIVKEMVSKTDNKNLGSLMGVFNKENKDKSFDNKTVQKIIKEELEG